MSRRGRPHPARVLAGQSPGRADPWPWWRLCQSGTTPAGQAGTPGCHSVQPPTPSLIPALSQWRNSDRLYADRDPLCTKQDSHDSGAQTAHDNVGGRVVFFASTKMGIGNIASPFNAKSLTHSEPGMRETANCPRVTGVRSDKRLLPDHPCSNERTQALGAFTHGAFIRTDQCAFHSTEQGVAQCV